MNSARLLPPTYLLIAIGLMVSFHFLWPGMMIISLPWSLLGIIPLGIGITVNMIAAGAFRRAATTIRPFETSNRLVTKGVYQLSRNPMYLGFVLILTGTAVIFGSLIPFVVIPLFMILIERNFIRVEEQGLEKKFGRHWLEYRQQVRRWL